MSQIKAVVVDPQAAGRLVIGTVAAPTPAKDEVLIRVAAISLNRGEVNGAMNAAAGARPGWDIAGTIEQAAADGSGPQQGARVVGFLPTGAWAELVAVPTHAVATLPESVTFAQAATLPVAGLTALYALEQGGSLLGRTVLITGASGGAGNFAIQLARAGGARVIGVVRQAAHAESARAAGAHEVVVSDDGAATAQYGPYNLIIDSVGGKLLGTIMGQVAKGGTIVNFGTSAGSDVTFDLRRFFPVGGVNLYGFILFDEVTRHPAGQGLARLAALIADGRLTPHIDREAPWTEIATIARELLDRRYAGKAVLHVG